jgi:MoaA/NifB/PqqE/SkfB family radical SAM enzyme
MNAMSYTTADCQSSTVPKAAAPDHLIHKLPIVVLFPHNRCNCRCVMCDIWRIRQVREITRKDLESHMDAFLALQVRWVVLSGGEPQLANEFLDLCFLLRAHKIRVTLLTAGLLLRQNAESVVSAVDDVVVSLDGPPQVHDQIRGVPGAFEKLANGIAALRRLRPDMTISGRCTIQKLNLDHLRDAVCAAKRIGLNSMSFLAADVGSEAFNRPGGWPLERQYEIALKQEELDRLETEIETLVREHAHDIQSGYIAESPEKLRRIGMHFRAHLRPAHHVAPRCNAPWVSAVIEADGTVRPCFFHRGLGNIHQEPLAAILNGQEALSFRSSLDVANNAICRRCVCSLYLNPNEFATLQPCRSERDASQ